MSEPEYLTIEQVAERLQVSPSGVRRWIDQGKLKAHKLGRLVRIRPADVVAFVEGEAKA